MVAPIQLPTMAVGIRQAAIQSAGMSALLGMVAEDAAVLAVAAADPAASVDMVAPLASTGVFQRVIDFMVAPTMASGTIVQTLVTTARFMGILAHARISGTPTTPPPIPSSPLKNPMMAPMPAPRAGDSSRASSGECSLPMASSRNSRTATTIRNAANITRKLLASITVLAATPASTKTMAAGTIRRANVHSIFPAMR